MYLLNISMFVLPLWACDRLAIMCAWWRACYDSHRFTYKAFSKNMVARLSNKATKDLSSFFKKLFRSSEWYNCYTVSTSGTRLSFSLTFLPCPAQMYYKSASGWSVCQWMPTHTYTLTQPHPSYSNPFIHQLALMLSFAETRLSDMNSHSLPMQTIPT